MNNSPLVSVVIPCYNASRFIKTAIDSALTQSHEHVEVIVVDDGSSDDSVSVVQSIHDPRVRLLQNDANLGAARSRNRALDVAQGEWIALLDGDDWFLPSRLEALLSAAVKHEADFVADDIYFVPENRPVDLERGLQENPRGYARPLRRLFRDTHLPHWLQIEDMLRERLPGGNDPRVGLVKPLFRRSFLEDHGIRYANRAWGEEDVPFYLDCLGHGARFLLVEGPWYCYRTHPGMTSHGWSEDDYQTRIEVNAVFFTRPYVQSNPALHRLFQRRQKSLKRDLENFRLAQRLAGASFAERLRLATRSTQIFSYLKMRLGHRLSHRREQLRNLPARLRELIGLGTTLRSDPRLPT
jgi:succinoglycan biosynthesis protein ExoO